MSVPDSTTTVLPDSYCTSGSSPTIDDVIHLPGIQPCHGPVIPGLTVGYRVVGPAGGPVVLVMGGISADRAVAEGDDHRGWWSKVVGPDPDFVLDTTAVRILSFDYLAGRGDTEPAGAALGAVTTRDQARTALALLDYLNIESISAVGCSYGGMVALALAELAPERVTRLVAIGAAHRSQVMATALRSIQRRIVRLTCGGSQDTAGLALARGLAMTSYRSAAEFEERFGGQPLVTGEVARFEVEDYLEARGNRFAQEFNSHSFLRLSQSLDLHQVDPSRITADCTLVAADSDSLVPAWLVSQTANQLACNATMVTISSRYGHDAFLKEADQLRPIVQSALQLAPQRDEGGSSPGPDLSLESATAAVRAGVASDRGHGAVMPPLYLSSNFRFEKLGSTPAYDYTRSGNPTRDLLGGAIAELEGGVAGIVTSSGMAALATVIQLLKPGDLLVAPHDCYGGSQRLLRAWAARQSCQIEFADLTATECLGQTLQRNPAMVLVETPSNPLLRITDLAAVATAARAAGATVVVDNTFLSPIWQRPLSWGADVVIHSTTKFLNGHSDVVGGAIVARDQGLAEELAWWGNCLGLTAAPFDCYMTLRGIRTLHARLALHASNTRSVVDLLVDHPAVRRVHYPGLPAHPGHAIAARQQVGFGSLVSFELADLEAVSSLTRELKLFTLAESLGGVESLIAHPASMTHASMDPEERRLAGIPDNLVRLSVGIEDPEDLVADLQNGLATVGGVR